MGALLYSAFTHHFKSQLKKQSSLDKGGGRTGLDQSKRKLNDVGHKDKSKGSQHRGQIGQGTILRSREQGVVEGYSRKSIRKYRRTWISTLYVENEEGRIKVDSSGERKWRNRWQTDSKTRDKGRRTKLN